MTTEDELYALRKREDEVAAAGVTESIMWLTRGAQGGRLGNCRTGLLLGVPDVDFEVRQAIHQSDFCQEE